MLSQDEIAWSDVDPETQSIDVFPPEDT